jgi:hypothetical protein
MVGIICFLLSPAALVWWEVSSIRKRLGVRVSSLQKQPVLRYRLSTLFIVTSYVATLLAVIRWTGARGGDVIVWALLVAFVVIVIWLALADIVHPKRVSKRCTQHDVPVALPPDLTPPPSQPSCETDPPVPETTPSGKRTGRGRRKHWWAKGLKRVSFGRYGLWKDSGPSIPD